MSGGLPEGVDWENVKPEELTAVLFYRGMSENREPMYAYIAVRSDKMKAFKKATASGKPMYLAEYGTVLASGSGEPTPEVMRKMRDEYNFDHENMLFYDLKDSK